MGKKKKDEIRRKKKGMTLKYGKEKKGWNQKEEKKEWH